MLSVCKRLQLSFVRCAQITLLTERVLIASLLQSFFVFTTSSYPLTCTNRAQRIKLQEKNYFIVVFAINLLAYNILEKVLDLDRGPKIL